MSPEKEKKTRRKKAEKELKAMPEFPLKVLAARKPGPQTEIYRGYVVFWKTSDGSYDNGLFYDDLKDAKECLADLQSDDKYIVRLTGSRL